MPLFRLSDEYMRLGEEVGNDTQDHADRHHYKTTFPTETLRPHSVLGSRSEIVVSLVTHLPWTGRSLTTSKGGDVGGFIQVRARSQPWHDMVVKTTDAPHYPVVLVLGHDAPMFDVVGWCLAEDGWQPQWRANHGGYGWAYFVPQSALERDFSLLPRSEDAAKRLLQVRRRTIRPIQPPLFDHGGSGSY